MRKDSKEIVAGGIDLDDGDVVHLTLSRTSYGLEGPLSKFRLAVYQRGNINDPIIQALLTGEELSILRKIIDLVIG